MAEETHLPEAAKDPKRRRVGKKKGSKSNKKAKMMSQSAEGNRGMKPKKIDKKMKKLFRKRAREYNSDDESEPEKEGALGNNNEEEELGGGSSSGEEAVAEGGGGHSMRHVDNEFSEDEEGGVIQPGITRFTEGCNAFRSAFRSIIMKSVPDDVLGPVLSAHKNLVAEKLAEEEAERKGKGEAKREKQLVIEKGHVKPANYLDAHEKFLIGVATKGVVKLFNAVNKAQNAQKGLNPSKFKDAKVIRKRRKEAFFSELRNTSSSSASAKARTSNDGEGPAWAPLRDNYMLTNPKLKDWDKMPDTVVADDIGRASEDSGSDDD